eukprot:CAMPEP_0115619440 /NCGR_PEP_ID=MMETSP0272-20121206/24682_1 /TAXON_ID=71861 /ORGANISM="Scrippsiella trochoidea, Strain CCMP3099" /LENGTH=153 /DNA_ID=CAMNT_0003055469 /DNA_START=439 /DNA_END=900 /DNA_ORIENTATION=+
MGVNRLDLPVVVLLLDRPEVRMHHRCRVNDNTSAGPILLRLPFEKLMGGVATPNLVEPPRGVFADAIGALDKDVVEHGRPEEREDDLYHRDVSIIARSVWGLHLVREGPLRGRVACLGESWNREERLGLTGVRQEGRKVRHREVGVLVEGPYP